MTDPIRHNRHSIRLKEYDYSLAGAYFVTIITYRRLNLFGNIVNGTIELTTFGKIASEQWLLLNKRFPRCSFSQFVIMPNHVHGVILMNVEFGEKNQLEHNHRSTTDSRVNAKGTKMTLGAIVRAYKASVTYRINAIRGFTKPPIWHRNYYEEIISSEREFENIWRYIEANPERWDQDRYHK